MPASDARRPHFLFVTGKLAEPALARLLAEIATPCGFDYSIAVLPITVAALATIPWIARHLVVPPGIDRVILPGLCLGDLQLLQPLTSASIERGPQDLRDLPAHLQHPPRTHSDYGSFEIAILAEINHAPRLSLSDLLQHAHAYRQAGADWIDLGCDPGSRWSQVGQAVRCLRQEGFRLSIDSFDPYEVEQATRAGAELVLSVNSSNAPQAQHWGVEVVAIPDVPTDLDSLEQTIEILHSSGVPFRLDPILEPIGLGFAASLQRYLEVRRRYPQAEILMGVGNLTELTDVDSAGINVLLLGFCQELGIRSVLTTQVINWARSSIRELDLARRLVFFAHSHRLPPKHVEPNLVLLRDPRVHSHGPQLLEQLQARLTDPNFRIFAERGQIHVLNRDLFLTGDDPFELFQQMHTHLPLDPAHAFYLGYEMAKAMTALTLGKNYTQDQALRWGFLTRDERSPRHEKLEP